MRLENKVAIITGATSGIGRAMVEAFAKEGATVYFTGRREEKGRAVETEINATGACTYFIKCDAAEDSERRALVKTVIEREGKIDILCNNAGIDLEGDHFMTLTKDKFDRIMNINLESYIEMIQLVVPYMKKAESGAILNTSSVSAFYSMPYNITYSMSKAALVNLAKGASKELAPDNIRINNVCPGVTYSEMVPVGGEFEQLMIGEIPMGRCGEAHEIAKAALFLVSDEASYITGQSLAIDGGLSVL